MSWLERLMRRVQRVFGMAARANGNGCQHNEIHLRQGSAEFECFVARGELESQGNLKHGAHHLANLLSLDPGNPEWIALLEQYLAAAGPDAERLIPREEKLYYSTEAMRAYIWYKQRRLEEAVDLLVQVVDAKPAARYLEAWALSWLEPAGAMESLTQGTGLRVLTSALMRANEARSAPLPRLREVERWARLGERFAPHLPGGDMAIMLRAGLLRKAGLFDAAHALVRPVMETSPNWHAATALGLILRQQDRCQEAEQAFQRAVELDPSDVSARLEAGDTFFERDQWQAALRWYENALAVEPNQPWAAPSAIYCRWKLTGDNAFFRKLVDLAKADAENHRARELVYEGSSGGFPEPVDATANLLRDIRQRILADRAGAPTGEGTLTLSSLEAPSNSLAFRLEMEALQHDLRLSVTVERIPKPDPRRPIHQGRYLLWSYDGIDASPALPAPSADVAASIARLAAARYHPEENWAAASRVAEELGPARVGEVLATMVHPPAVPEGWTALGWLPRVQTAAAQVAAQVDGGWQGSARREALRSVLLGPSDWTTSAAIAVLARLGRENEAIAPDIHDAFQQLADHRPDGGFCCWERNLYAEWLTLPHLFDREREQLEKTLRAIDDHAEKEK